MSKVWILVADDMSAAHVADVASKSGAPYEALVFGDASRADAVAALGPASVTLYDTSATLAEALAPAIADRAAQEQPAAVLCSDDATARAIAGAIAVKLSAAVAAAVTSVSVSEGKTVVERLVADAAAVQVLLETSGPAVCIVADGGDEADAGAAAEVATGSASALDLAPCLPLTVTGVPPTAC